MKRSLETVLLWACSAALAIFVIGCSTVAEKPKLIELMWPEPPETPRIKFVKTLASEVDLGRQLSFSETLVSVVAGKKPEIGHLAEPMAIAVSDDGQRVFVSDYGQARVYRFDLAQNKVTFVGNGRPLNRPFGVALDAAENLYVVEQGAKHVRVFDRAGNELKVISHPSLVRPTDIAIDRSRGRIYVADPAGTDAPEHTVKIFDLDGTLVGKIGKGKGDCDGCLFFPTYVAVGPDGKVYVTSTLSASVAVFDPDGKFIRRIGERGTGFGMFDRPKGVAFDTFGNLYVVDAGWSNVQIFNPKGEILLFFGGRGSYPGLMKNPSGIAIDKNNRIYVGDFLNYRLSIYDLVNTKAQDSFVSLPPETEKGGETRSKSGG
jgi:DNA-binding beta-propeller fold protein YncE